MYAGQSYLDRLRVIHMQTDQLLPGVVVGHSRTCRSTLSGQAWVIHGEAGQLYLDGLRVIHMYAQVHQDLRNEVWHVVRVCLNAGAQS